MAYKDVQPLIYQEMKRDGFDFKKGYFELDFSKVGNLNKYIKMSGFRYTDRTGKSTGRAFYDSMVRYHDKVKKGTR